MGCWMYVCRANRMGTVISNTLDRRMGRLRYVYTDMSPYISVGPCISIHEVEDKAYVEIALVEKLIEGKG